MNCTKVFWKTSKNFPHAAALDINGLIYKYKDIVKIAKNIQAHIERLSQTEVVTLSQTSTVYVVSLYDSTVVEYLLVKAIRSYRLF